MSRIWCSQFAGQWLLIASLITAATALPANSAPGGGTQIVIAQSADITTADPRLGGIAIDYSTYFQMCDPLVTFDKNSKIVPALASSWRVVNPTTYEFAIRPGARFHDGTPVTAADVKATMDRILDPAFKSEVIAPDYEPLIKSTEIVNPMTVRFNLKVPFGGFLNRMVYIFPVSQQAVQKLGDKEFARQPVCAGPYKLVEWVPDDHVLLEAFDGYWGGRAKIDRIVIRPIPQASTRAAALRAGDVDLAVNIVPDQIPGIKQDAKLNIVEVDSGRREFFILDATSEPFRDRRVRQAINHAVDWNAITKSIMGGFGRPLPGPAMSYMFGYKEVRGYEYSPSKARQLLSAAGYPQGFDLTVESPNGRYLLDKEIAQAVVGYLRTVAGINANLQVYEWGQYVGRRRTKQFKMGLWGALSLYRDFDDFGFLLEPERASNMYSNPEITKLFEQGRAEPDPAKRRAIYSRLADLIVEDAPWLFGPVVVAPYGINRRLRWEPRAGTDILFDLKNATLQ